MLEERLRVVGFNEMGQFMHDDILEDVARFLDQLGVDPDRPELSVAASLLDLGSWGTHRGIECSATGTVASARPTAKLGLVKAGADQWAAAYDARDAVKWRYDESSVVEPPRTRNIYFLTHEIKNRALKIGS